MQISIFLKRVLLLDAASCLGMGLMLSLGASALSPLFGLDLAIVQGAGFALLPVGLFMAGIATRSSAPALFVYAVIAGNLLWTAESMILIGSTPTMTLIGEAFVAIQAVAVAGLAALEYLGVRKSLAATV
ncbi:MAG: hypothetical protein H0W74_11630 [Sphingosinicella sp.]|nr:hypothetical protein [Sphingosinicella sp.]